MPDFEGDANGARMAWLWQLYQGWLRRPAPNDFFSADTVKRGVLGSFNGGLKLALDAFASLTSEGYVRAVADTSRAEQTDGIEGVPAEHCGLQITEKGRRVVESKLEEQLDLVGISLSGVNSSDTNIRKNLLKRLAGVGGGVSTGLATEYLKILLGM